MSQQQDQKERKTLHKIHAAFSKQHNADAYERKLNEDQDDDEERAYVETVVLCELDGKWIADKTCFKVSLMQKGMTKFVGYSIEGHPFINTAWSVSGIQVDDYLEFVWIGWATSNTDAMKRAKVAAISGWMGIE